MRIAPRGYPTPARAPRLRFIPLTAALALLLLGHGAEAQVVPGPGDSIRITIGDQAQVYQLVDREPGTLIVRRPGGTLQLPVAYVNRVERRVPANRGQTIARTTLVAAITGAVMGGILGYATSEDPAPDCWLFCYTRTDVMMISAALLGGLGLVGGLIISSLTARDWKWQKVDPAGLYVGVSPAGGARLAVRLGLP